MLSYLIFNLIIDLTHHVLSVQDQFDLALEEYDSRDYEMSSSDEDDGITGRTSSIFKIAEPLTDRAKRQQLMRSELTSAASSRDGALSMHQQSFDFLSKENILST